MCIALFSTAHPGYALIVITNRDEYLDRPTLRADWWEAPDSHVLGGRDLQRSVRGTWLGVTRDGRIATLTNFRDPDDDDDDDGADSSRTVSRGAMVNAYLRQKPGAVQETEAFARGLISGSGGARGSGGFTLVCGRMGEGERGLAVVSNRMAGGEGPGWVGGERGRTVGLSNTAFGDRSWPKVAEGEELLARAIERNVADEGGDGERLIEGLQALLARDTLPKELREEGWSTVVRRLKDSIFIPVVGGSDGDGKDTKYYGDEIASGRSARRVSVNRLASGSYGTSKQTVVLLDHDRNVTFIEKTLYEDGMRTSRDADSTRRFTFKIES